MRKHVFIGGAHKCGTSSLFSYLSAHPFVNASNPKETFFFMDDDHPLINPLYNFSKNDINGFDKFFNKKNLSTEIRLEATTHYLFQENIIDKLKQLGGQLKIIFILREPASRVYSSFKYTQNNLANISNQITFTQYVDDLTSERLEIPDYLSYKNLYVLKNDIEYSKYVLYLEKWYQGFDESQIKLLLFENLKENPREVLFEISNFLEISDDEFDNIKLTRKNVTVRVNNQPLHKLALAINKRIGKFLPPSFKSFYKSALSSTQGRKSREDQLAIEKLKRLYRSYNAQLSDRYGLDVRKWN